MKKLLTVIIALMMVATSLNAKTLIVYYSFTNNIRTVINELSTQIEADVLEVLPKEENVDYAANNYITYLV
jgi:flavodoxin